MAYSKVNLTYIDNSKERTTFSVPVPEIDALNHDTEITLIGNLQTAMDALTLGAPAKRSIVHSDVDYVYTVPTDVNANREVGVMFTLQGTSEPKNKVRATIGAPDLADFPFVAAQSDIVEAPFSGLSADLTAAIAAMEAVIVHPVSGETMTVQRMEKIGRNL